MTDIDPDRPIDELISEHPDLVKYLIQQGLPCVVCGEPFWGTLRELATGRGWEDRQVDELCKGFQSLHQ